MTQNSPDITALIGSRICHDLISPIGAISNGVELMGMTVGNESPEMGLIQQSVDNASARIKFFRIAFGLSSTDQQIGRSEITAILDGFFEPTRLTVSWLPQVNCQRAEVKEVFLLMLCLETAMPYGGLIKVMLTDDIWTVQGETEKFREEPETWERLEQGGHNGLSAAQVQFVLAHDLAFSMGRKVTRTLSEGRMALSF